MKKLFLHNPGMIILSIILFLLTESSVKLDWGKIELAVGDKVKITAIEGMEYDTIYMSSMTDEDMLGYYNQLKKFLTKEGVLK